MSATGIRRGRLAALCLAAVAASPPGARAAERGTAPDGRDLAAGAPWWGAELQVSGGFAPAHAVVRDSRLPFVLGLAGLASLGPLLAGPVGTVSVAQDGTVQDQSLYVGLGAGYALRFAGRWRASALAEGGVHVVYALQDRALEAAYPAVSLARDVRLPYAGLRFGIDLEDHRERSWRDLWTWAGRYGLALFVRRDLRSGTARLDYSDARIIALPPVVRGSSTYAVGGWTAGVVLAAAAAW
jgi:hypothetical protein